MVTPARNADNNRAHTFTPDGFDPSTGIENWQWPSAGHSTMSYSDTMRLDGGKTNGGFMEHSPAHSIGSDYQLECHNVSYIRSFTTGRWYSKVFNPPITAQFLKDVNLEVHAGEVMGVIGSSGSGKTTLLNVIARRVQGTTAGSILLNQRPMTERAFQNNCAYVSFKQSLLPSLTVQETLFYQARLGLAAAVSNKEKSERVTSLMRDFELTDHSSRKVGTLEEADRRRLLIAMHLVRDPVLLLVDEPNRGLDSLTSYQLMYNLYQYMKRYHRMAIVSTILPRSDIYQLFDRLTILFFGEVVYSGYTKQMPVYFRQIGYPCPASENPAIYYLSLATVDRETSERYSETQEQAVKLIEIFKGQGEQFSAYRGPGGTGPESVYGYGSSSALPLAHLGRPNGLSRFFTLIRRTYRTYMWSTMVLRLMAFPLLAMLLTFLCFNIHPNDPFTPYSRAGIVFNVMFAASCIAIMVTASTGSIHRLRYYQESWDNLYGGITYIMAQLTVNFPLDVLALLAGCAIIMWGCRLSTSLEDYLMFSLIIWCCWQFSQLCTLALMVVIKNGFTSVTIAGTFAILSITLAGGFTKAYTTFIDSTSWLHYVTYASIYRYAGIVLYEQQIRNVTTQCDRPDNAINVLPINYCKWASGVHYLEESYPSDMLSQQELNVGVCLAFVGAMTLIVLVLYALPLPHFIKRKFRFK